MAPKKRPGKYVGLPTGSPDKPLEWSLSTSHSKPPSIFHLRTRTMRGKKNRSEVLGRAQRFKKMMLEAEEKLNRPITADGKVAPSKIILPSKTDYDKIFTK